jgi:hypothetical protein
VADELDEPARDDLPREAERIRDPAALRRPGAGPDELVPVFVDLVLVLAVDVEEKPSEKVKGGPPLKPMKNSPPTTNSAEVMRPSFPARATFLTSEYENAAV